MSLQESIRIILKEETNKFELVKNFIYTMYDNVRFVEYNTKFNEVMVYYTNHDKRQMLIPTEICEMITNYTGLDVVPYWDTNRESDNQPDFYLDTEEYEEKLNESEDKGGKFISLIEDLTETFKNEDCVCDIKISYKSEEFRDLYLINVVLGINEINNKFKGINYQIRNYLQQLRRKITDGIFDFLPIPFFVNFSETPKCKDYKNLKESKISDKIKSFLGKKPLAKDDKLIDIIVKFIEEIYSIDFESDDDGNIKFYLTNDRGNWIFPAAMEYFPKPKILHYSWKFAEDIHNRIGDDRLLQNDSEMMGKIFEKLFNKKVIGVYGYSRL